MSRVQFIIESTVAVDLEQARELLRQTSRAEGLQANARGFTLHASAPGRFELDTVVTLERQGDHRTGIAVVHDVDVDDASGTSISVVVRELTGITEHWLAEVEKRVQRATPPKALAAPPPQGRLAPAPSKAFTLHVDLSCVIKQSPAVLLDMLRASAGATIDGRNNTATIDRILGTSIIEQQIHLRRVRGGTAVDIHATRRGTTPAGVVLNLEGSTEKFRDSLLSYFSGLGTITAIDRVLPQCPQEQAVTAAPRPGAARRGNWIGLGG